MHRIGGQFRIGKDGVIGLDMVAVFQIGRGLGLSDLVMAEVLPAIETAAVSAMRSNSQQSGE